MANNRLPYGLCKKYGIELPKGATPREAWAALDKIPADKFKKPLVAFIGEESPRKTRQGNYSVNWSFVHSSKYKEKLYKISQNEKVVSAIETRIMWALNNRDGVDTEEIYAINLSNGSEVTRITDQHFRKKIKRTVEFQSRLDEADSLGEKILLLHNHPDGLPPSIYDINVLINNLNVVGITVGHDGSLYYYTRPNKPILNSDFISAIKNYNDFTEITAIEKALEELQEKFGFLFKKL